MTALEEKMAELRQRFAARSGVELEVLDGAIANGDLETIVDRAHKLAGIAGMFGYEEIGEAALILEQAALRGEPTGAVATSLRNLLAGLAAD